MRELTVKNIVLAGLFIALGLVLPFLTGQIPQIGSKLLPMHIPVLVSGFVLGGPVGALVGFITPLLRSIIFGMPPLFPTAAAMAFELAAYGYLTGVFHRLFPRRTVFLYITLIFAMLGGRVVWGMVSFMLYGLGGRPFDWDIFIAGAFGTAILGIIIQLVIIPLIVANLPKSGYRRGGLRL